MGERGERTDLFVVVNQRKDVREDRQHPLLPQTLQDWHQKPRIIPPSSKRLFYRSYNGWAREHFPNHRVKHSANQAFATRHKIAHQANHLWMVLRDLL